MRDFGASDVVHNEANPAVSTKDPLDGVAAQYVRIKMQRPHPRLGKYEEKYRYAIKEINIFAGKLEPAVGDCREAASSDDARDKYFIYYVSGFDEDFARKTTTLGVDVIAKRKSLEEISGKLEELFAEMDDCREEKIQQRQRIKALRATAGRLMANFQLVAGRAKAYSIMQLLPGRQCHKGSFSSSRHSLSRNFCRRLRRTPRNGLLLGEVEDP
ncbi:hypothetical protein, conserved [Eimeria necatrix]|uniref:Uncharacterized protein n=1 Tax=Eimeria necatrix TaxID=51315 RepID=U6MUC8_9EIME|nr:hypothetical protein, conserved [Eimeria necatrix]CDJ65295.1 hypothetical protein, conserved [Eimeria necatrix]